MADPRINLYHNLSVMLAAGVPIVRTLQTVPKNGRIGRVFAEIAESVARAESLAEAVQARQRHFAPLDVALIRVGEDTGQLAEVFAMLAGWYDFRQRIRRVIQSGLLLPAMMIHALALLAPVPGFALGGWDVQAYVRNVIGILMLFYIPTAVILGILFLTPRRGSLRTLLDAIVLKIPVLGKAVRDLALSRYCKIFAIMLKAGVPILRSAELAVHSAQNAMIRRAVQGGTEAVKRGDNISEGFRNRLLPAEFIAIWQVGEETGDLDESTERLGRNYAENAERGFQTVAVWTPRIVYAIVAGAMIYHIFNGFSDIYGNLGDL